MSAFQIHIDATKLVYRAFLVPGVTKEWTDSRRVQTLQLAPGQYNFQIGSGFYCDFTFSITAQGTVAYDPVFAPFLSGAGTQTLVLGGFPVTLDARYMPGLGLIWSGDLPSTNEDWFTLKTCYMLPATGYRMQQGSGVVCDFSFGLDIKGHFQYAPTLDVASSGPLRGLNTSTLTFLGFPILIDARQENASGVALQPVTWGVPFARTSVLFLNLLPAKGFRLQFESGVVTQAGFDLDSSGKIALHPYALDLLSLDTFHGLTRLNVERGIIPPIRLPKVIGPAN